MGDLNWKNAELFLIISICPAQFLRSPQGLCRCNIDTKLNWRNVELFWILSVCPPNFCAPRRDSATAILIRHSAGGMPNYFGFSQLSRTISALLARILPLQY